MVVGYHRFPPLCLAGGPQTLFNHCRKFLTAANRQIGRELVVKFARYIRRWGAELAANDSGFGQGLTLLPEAFD